MAVPSLAAMAGLTLFHMQQEWREGMTKRGVTPKMSLAQPPFNSDTHVYASRIQRRQRRRRGAATRIAAALRGLLVRSYEIITLPFGGPVYNNVLAARRRYRSTSRNRTFGNVPLSMQTPNLPPLTSTYWSQFLQ